MPQQVRKPRKRDRTAARQRGSRGGAPIAVAAIAVFGVLIVVAAVSFMGRGSTFEPAVTPLEDVTRIGDIEVTAPAVDLGRVPLDTWADHEFVLRNVGQRTVSLGEVFVRTLEGC